MKHLLLFLLAIQTSFADKPKLQPKIQHFTTKECAENVVNLIDSLKTNNEIKINVYSISYDVFLDKLMEAHKRGVKIKVITDNVQFMGSIKREQKYQLEHPEADRKLWNFIKTIGIENFRIDGVYRIMHDKVAIFNNKHAITGSYNWTRSASTVNAENCIILDVEKSVNFYNDRFNRMWEENKNPEYTKCILDKIETQEDTKDCKQYKPRKKKVKLKNKQSKTFKIN